MFFQLRRRFADYLSKGTGLSSDALVLDGFLISQCSSLASLLVNRLYTLQSFAAQAFVTFLSVAGRHFDEGASTPQDQSEPRECIQPLQPTLGNFNSPCFFY